MKRKLFAFTLAEVLITLSIIGIVAAITIPTLIKNYQNKQYVTQLKKTYTQINQALYNLAADNGCTGDLKCTGFVGIGTTDTTFGDKLMAYFNVLKNCKVQSTLGCFTTKTCANYDGTGNRTTFPNVMYAVILKDGAALSIDNFSHNCAWSYSTGKTGNMRQMCGEIKIDVNGPQKGPNNLGRDIFRFYITNGKGPMLYPFGGIDDSTNGWWKNPTTGAIRNCYPNSVSGIKCSARVMEEGWEMNY